MEFSKLAQRYLDACAYIANIQICSGTEWMMYEVNMHII